MSRCLDFIFWHIQFHYLQIQLDGLKQICTNNHMIANEINTKVMVFGNPTKSNSVDIEEVNDYEYLGNIISSARLPKHDPLKKTCSFLCGQAQRASFSMTSKIKAMGTLPVDVMLNLFDVLIKPIHGSDVWGLKSKLWGSNDKVFLQYARCMLLFKATT